MVLIGLRIRLAAAPVHAVLVGTVVAFAPRDDNAGAFGQGLDLSSREGRIGRLRCHHSSSSVTGTPRARARRLRTSSEGGAWDRPRSSRSVFNTVFSLPAFREAA